MTGAAEDEKTAEVEEHLQDAMEGSFRMKRLLEREADDEEEGISKLKKPKTERDELANKLLEKWQLTECAVCRYVMNDQTLEELQFVEKSNYFPDKNNQWKHVSELLNRHLADCREMKTCTGGPLDQISAVKHRYKLGPEQDKELRMLSHKDLRYVLETFEGSLGSRDLMEVIEEAKEFQPDEQRTETAVLEKPGLTTMGRFGRLELIDPLADAAVFGDANLTFAMKLVKHREALGHAGRVIATTFEDLPTLRERYPEIDKSIELLESHFANVYHSVDCTRIAVDPKFKGMEGSFGAVYYNFPHSGAVGGFFDSHPMVNWRHENLMRLFFRALRSYVKPGGIVKVASNSGAVGVRYSYIVESGKENEFVHTETIPFLEWHLHRYGRSYGDRRDSYKRPDAQNNQSYNAQAGDKDMVYCFRYAPSGEAVGKATVRIPPPLSVLKQCVDGPFKTLQGDGKVNKANQLHERFVSEASGIHVG